MKIEPGQLVVVNVEKAVSPENLSLSPTTKHGIIYIMFEPGTQQQTQ